MFYGFDNLDRITDELHPRDPGKTNFVFKVIKSYCMLKYAEDVNSHTSKPQFCEF